MFSNAGGEGDGDFLTGLPAKRSQYRQFKAYESPCLLYRKTSLEAYLFDESNFHRWVAGLLEIVAAFAFAKNPIVTSIFERW